MAAGRLSAPGTHLGACAEECQHLDCAETKRMAAAPCRWCHAPIGYMPGNGIARWDGRSGEFYEVGGGEFAHAVCEEEALEEQRQGGRPVPAERG